MNETASDIIQLLAQFNCLETTDKPFQYRNEIINAALAHLGLVKSNSAIEFINHRNLGYARNNMYIRAVFYANKYPKKPDYKPFLDYLDTEPEILKREDILPLPDCRTPEHHENFDLLGW